MFPNTPGAPAPVGHTGHLQGQDKGAVTRFNNDRVASARRMMNNGSAAQALKMDKGSVRPPRNLPVPSNNTEPPAQMAQIPNSGNMEQPQQMLMDQQPMQMIDPAAEFQAMVDLEMFVNGQEFGDALTKSRLVNYFKGLPNDPQRLSLQVLENLRGQPAGLSI